MSAAGLPQTIEWVHETTPTLLDAVRAAGSFELEELPLLVLDGDLAVTAPRLPDGVTVRLLGPDDAEAVSAATAASAVGFGAEGTARGDAGPAERDAAREAGPAAGPRPARRRRGPHRGRRAGRARGRLDRPDLPVGDVTEVMGVATLPSARRQGLGAAVTAALVDDARDLGLRTVFLTASSDDVARVYSGIGFQRVGTGWAPSGTDRLSRNGSACPQAGIPCTATVSGVPHRVDLR